MHPEVGGWPSYGLLLFLGFATGMVVFRQALRSRGEDVEHGTDVILLVFLAALAGARLFHVLFGPASYRQAPWRLLALWDGGLSFQGGLMAGAAALWLLRNRVNFRPFLDAAALGLVMGHFWGRIGCLMAGCCWGKAHPSWPGRIVLAEKSAAALHYHAYEGWTGPLLPMIPVQAYEAAFLLLLFLAGSYLLSRRKLAPGNWFSLYLVLYGAGRFFLEMLRGDPGRGFLFRLDGLFPVSTLTENAVLLSAPQIVSLGMAALGVFLYRHWAARGITRDRNADPPRPDPAPRK